MARFYVDNIFGPKISAWETKEARFLQIEFSPSHILKIKVDKKLNNKGKGGEVI